jgi:hypothetical protein
MAPSLPRPPVDQVDALDPRSRFWLGLLRVGALECRSARRLALWEACAGLGGQDAAECARALVRTLPEGLGRRLAIRRPGEARLSFDEAWLLSLLDASARGDAASTAFLLRSRASSPCRRGLARLASAMARGAPGLDLGRAASI